MAAADRDHAVDSLQSGGHRLAHRLTINHAGSEALERYELVGRDGTFVVDGLAERVHHASDHVVADRHAHDASGALDLVAFLDLSEFAEQHDADLVLFQVHGDTGHPVRERQQFAGHDFVETVHTRDAVTQGDDGACLVHGNLGFVVLDLLAD